MRHHRRSELDADPVRYRSVGRDGVVVPAATFQAHWPRSASPSGTTTPTSPSMILDPLDQVGYPVRRLPLVRGGPSDELEPFLTGSSTMPAASERSSRRPCRRGRRCALRLRRQGRRDRPSHALALSMRSPVAGLVGTDGTRFATIGADDRQVARRSPSAAGPSLKLVTRLSGDQWASEPSRASFLLVRHLLSIDARCHPRR